jgi:hypothetical protein
VGEKEHENSFESGGIVMAPCMHASDVGMLETSNELLLQQILLPSFPFLSLKKNFHFLKYFLFKNILK